ncbi:hypothetical protein N9L47_11070 [Rhodobacteraceae bacterium]|nr:hypothetical protein [Paracoccaceae bacterium]
MPKKPGLSVGYMIVDIFKTFFKSLAQAFGQLMGAMLAGGVIGAIAGGGAGLYYGLPILVAMGVGAISGVVIVTVIFFILHAGV